MKKTHVKFADDHPTAAGHFPGNPIIPGALLLAEVLRAITLAEEMVLDSCNVKAAKFLHPARPGDSVEIEYQVSPKNVIDFSCAVGTVKVLSGVVSASA